MSKTRFQGFCSKVLVAVLFIFGSSIFMSGSARADDRPWLATVMGSPYNGTSGYVPCLTNGAQTGYFIIANNVFTSSSADCAGDMVIPAGVTKVDFRATWDNDDKITSLIFPNSVTEIGQNSFTFQKFTTVRIPDGVTSIGQDAFAYGHLTTIDYCGTSLSTETLITATGGLDGDDHPKFTLTCSAPRVTVAAGRVANSQVATIPSGIRAATIPASASLPATSLNFGGSVPDSVTVVPVASNPASVSATPFTISGSTKIVDIQISGTFSGSATVCLDGAPTDHLYHFTGGAWVELPSRTYVNGQVCGVTTSFSPFAAAAPALVAAPTPAPVPDPVQQSKITALSVSTAIAGTSTPVAVSGSFVEKISAIHINGVALASGTWTQTASSVAFTMPGKSAGTYQIQIYNGSAPVMKVQNFTFTAPIVVVAPTPAPSVKQKVTYIRCAKPGRGTRVAYGINPTCPEGYVKK